MQTTVTNQGVWSGARSVTVVSPAKMAELIEMPFELWNWVCLRKHVLDGGPNSPLEGKYRDCLPWAVQKRLNRSRCNLGCWVGRPKEPGNRWGPDPVRRGNYDGKGMNWHEWWHSATSCARTAEPIKMPFGLWTQVAWKKHVLHVTLAQAGEYDWTIHVRWGCGQRKNYFNHLLEVASDENTFHSKHKNVMHSHWLHTANNLALSQLHIYTVSQKTSHLWPAITLMYMNRFWYFLAEMLPIK